MTRAGRHVGRAASAIAIVAVCFALTKLGTGCGAPCSPSEQSTAVATVQRGGGWALAETSPPKGPFLPFEGQNVLRVEHNLGVRPWDIEIFLSFSREPEAFQGGGSTPSAGNQTVFVRIDEREVVIKNDSCANYFIRVVLKAPLPDANDAGTDAAVEAGSDAPDAADALDARDGG